VVTNFLGQAYNSGTQEGSTADGIRIYIQREFGDMVADLSNGDLYWYSGSQIYKFDNTEKTVSEMFSDNNTIGGIAILNSKIYFSDTWNHVIKELTFDGSNYSSEVVVGNSGSNDYNYNQIKSFSENMIYYPGELVADPVKNRIYANGYTTWYDNSGLRRNL
jgi:hypothetical protein